MISLLLFLCLKLLVPDVFFRKCKQIKSLFLMHIEKLQKFHVCSRYILRFEVDRPMLGSLKDDPN